jgi:predicted AAA+ superfamily ATPase
MYYQREIETKIQKYIDSPEIIAIFGSRQVGKTTILKHIYNKIGEISINTNYRDCI